MNSIPRTNNRSGNIIKKSPEPVPLSVSETLRVHSRSPKISSAIPSSSQMENFPRNSENDLVKPPTATSQLLKPRLDEHLIVKHGSGERCTSCFDNIILLKEKDKEIRSLQDEVTILQERLTVSRDEVLQLQNELDLYKDCLAMAKAITEESLPQN